MIIFAKASNAELYALMNILNCFSKAFGQMINLNKSSLVFSKDVLANDRVLLGNILNIPVWENDGSYLGVPAEWIRSKVHVLGWIKDRVCEKIDGWKEKMPNQAGKEILTKSIIQAIPSYVMFGVSLPKTFCRQLCSMVAKFWWKSDGKDRGIHLKTLKVLTSAKGEGGVGFKDFEEMNEALLDGQAWRIMQEDFWSVKKKNGDSWFWSSIFKGIDLLKKNGRWAIGNGASISLREDIWLHNGAKIKLNEPCPLFKVKDIIDTSNKAWNLQLIRQHFHLESDIEVVKTLLVFLMGRTHFGGLTHLWVPILSCLGTILLMLVLLWPLHCPLKLPLLLSFLLSVGILFGMPLYLRS